MRLFRWLSLFVLVGLLPTTGHAQGPSGVAFHGTGDLAGGPTFSLVRDATRVGGLIYAVGGSAAVNQVLCVSPNNPVGCVPAFGPDTATLWTWDGSSGQLTALPNLVVNATANVSMQASAITPDAAYIASQARSIAVGGNRLAVRVDRSQLPNASANLNLNVAPFVAYTQPTAAQAVSNNGAVLVTAVNPSTRVARVDVNNAAGNVLVPLLRPSDTNNQPLIRGLSANGTVLVGTSFANPYSGTVGGQAFRYVFNPATNTGSLAGIPFLPGGTWNRPAALSPNGQFTLVTGNSPLYPNGEYAIHDAATNTFTSLGSANTPWTPSPLAGMTADRSVVVATFNASNGYHQGYFHNANGWFHLESALGANGVDVITDGWRQLFAAGISADGTLVYGQGLHNGNTEGFVAEFPAGYLAGFDVPAIPATDTAIVGTWQVPSDTPGDPQPGGVLAFLADGTYFFVQQHNSTSPSEAAGFERGRYTWNAATGAFTIDTVQDMNGDSGASDANGQLNLSVTVVGDTLTITDPDDPGGGPSAITRLIPVAGTFVGGWIGGDPTQPDESLLFVGMPDGTYYMANDVEANGGDHDGIEWGTFIYDTSTGIISGTPSVDTNGTIGFSNTSGPITLHISADDLTASGTDDMGEPIFIHRIVDPNTVRPTFTSAGAADGTLGAPFTFATSATFGAFSFSATGLPAGLSIDAATGVISGTPAALGAFAVTLSASNSLATGDGVLIITILDGTAPVIDAVADISETTGNTGGAPVVYTSPATHDNVDADGVAICMPASGSNFAVGTTIVNCSATDAAGNTATSSFTVTVTYLPPPPPSLPGHMHAAGYIAGGGGAQPDRLRFDFDVLQQPTGAHHLRFSFWTVDFSERPRRTNVFDATDITSVMFADDPAFLSGHHPNAAAVDSVVFSGSGEFNDLPGYSFTVTASDRGEPGKNLDTFSLEVRDGGGAVVYSASGLVAGGNVQSLRLPNRRLPPFISGGPSTVTEIEAANANGAVFNYALPVAVDMDGAAVAVNCSPASGTVFPMGRTHISCTATDAAGRTSTERYRVIVSDSVAPAFTSTPSNITVAGTHAAKGAKVDYATPSAADAVDASVAVSCAPASGRWFDYGTTLVTCTAKDNAKNKSTVTFTITVVR